MKRLVRLHLHCTLHTDKQTVINVLKILTVKSSFYMPTLRKKKRTDMAHVVVTWEKAVTRIINTNMQTCVWGQIFDSLCDVCLLDKLCKT